jgi:hypothetical protein
VRGFGLSGDHIPSPGLLLYDALHREAQSDLSPWER